MRRALTVVVLLLPVSAAAQPAAQTPTGDQPRVTPYFRDLTRVESWSFFEPNPGGGDPTYTFVGNRATMGVRVSSVRFDIDASFQYAQLLHLPPRAIGPGALGTGALYFAAAEFTEAYQLYFNRMLGRAKNVLPGLNVTGGRMGYTSGAEAQSGIEALESVKRLRLDSRLIGNFEWSIFERAYDGVRVDFNRASWAATGGVLFPTQGGFEESAGPTISTLRLLTSAVTLKPRLVPHSEIQAFAHRYRDRRDVQARPDNTGSQARAVDVTVSTFGASLVGAYPVATSELDTLIWIAAQTGDWYGQSHRASSVAAEGGFRFRLPWSPWVRGGVLMASGDDDPADDRHGTFFQMLPTVRRYSLSATYSQMNLRDAFAQVLFRPSPRLSARTDLHHLTLADRADFWYAGSGATASTGRFFGYAARPSGGGNRLGIVTEGALDVRLRRYWSMNGYVGVFKGGDVVRRSFAGDRLTFWYVENVLSF